MAYRMVQLPMSEAQGSFCNTHNSGYIACFNYSVFTHELKVHEACGLDFIGKGGGLLKVTGSHIHWKSDDITERGCFIEM